MTEDRNEVYISVDTEASGPIPGEYSVLSLVVYLSLVTGQFSA